MAYRRWVAGKVLNWQLLELGFALLFEFSYMHCRRDGLAACTTGEVNEDGTIIY